MSAAVAKRDFAISAAMDAARRGGTTPAMVASSVAFGTVSGFVSSVLLQPLDRLKTLSQQEAVRRANSFYNAKILIQRHGVLDLWRGITPTLLRVVPGVALYFGFVEAGRAVIPSGANANAANFALGAASRTLAASLLMPATVIKTRFESDLYRDAGVFAAATDIVQRSGFRGLFKGIVPTLMRDAPFSGLYLMFYRKNLQLFNKDETVHAPGSRFVCGVLAGILACAVTQPFDIAKTHVQLYPNKYSSLFHVACCIYKDGGIVSFFNGFWLRASRRTLMVALNWTVFDELFGVRFHHHG